MIKNIMENYESEKKEKSNICKKWLVIERCSTCLFETLCRLEDQKKRFEEND